MIAAIVISTVVFLAILGFIFVGRKKHRFLDGTGPLSYDPDEHGEMDPGMILAALAFQTGQMCFMNQISSNQWQIQCASGISGEGSTPAEAYKSFMEKYNESKTGIRK